MFQILKQNFLSSKIIYISLIGLLKSGVLCFLLNYSTRCYGSVDGKGGGNRKNCLAVLGGSDSTRVGEIERVQKLRLGDLRIDLRQLENVVTLVTHNRGPFAVAVKVTRDLLNDPDKQKMIEDLVAKMIGLMDQLHEGKTEGEARNYQVWKSSEAFQAWRQKIKNYLSHFLTNDQPEVFFNKETVQKSILVNVPSISMSRYEWSKVLFLPTKLVLPDLTKFQPVEPNPNMSAGGGEGDRSPPAVAPRFVRGADQSGGQGTPLVVQDGPQGPGPVGHTVVFTEKMNGIKVSILLNADLLWSLIRENDFQEKFSMQRTSPIKFNQVLNKFIRESILNDHFPIWRWLQNSSKDSMFSFIVSTPAFLRSFGLYMRLNFEIINQSSQGIMVNLEISDFMSDLLMLPEILAEVQNTLGLELTVVGQSLIHSKNKIIRLFAPTFFIGVSGLLPVHSKISTALLALINQRPQILEQLLNLNEGELLEINAAAINEGTSVRSNAANQFVFLKMNGKVILIGLHPVLPKL
ncbi:MAG: hypothetical protein K1X29_03345 [Bdellovibrionales bacterium]|nr:hypothetical protein [Bdellovibrionales bacterium]